MSIILQDQLTLSTQTKEQVEKNTQDIAKNTKDIEDLEEKIAVVYKFKGSVNTYADLPTEDNQTGDVWDVKADDMNYAWTADGEWDQLGPTVDLSGYVPTSRTINNKTLESDITLEPSDIGAATAAQGELADTALQSDDLKTINGTSIVGEGDIVITTNYSFKDTWTTDSTTNTFLNDVYTDEDAIPGMTYLGELTCSDLPTGLNNAEAIVEVMPSATAAEKVIHVVITSGNLSPYRWELTYWVIGNTPHNSGWIAFQPQITSSNKLNSDLVTDTNQTNKFVTASEKTTWSGKQDALVSGTNIKTVNNTSLLGEGNITIDSLPSQTGNADKFLTTDGTDASWATIPLPGDATESTKGVVKLATTAEAEAGVNDTKTMTPLKTSTAIQSKFLTGITDPTTATAGFVGQTYVNTVSGNVFKCTGYTDSLTPTITHYGTNPSTGWIYDSSTGYLHREESANKCYVFYSPTVSVENKDYTIVERIYKDPDSENNYVLGSSNPDYTKRIAVARNGWYWVKYSHSTEMPYKLLVLLDDNYTKTTLPDDSLWTDISASHRQLATSGFLLFGGEMNSDGGSLLYDPDNKIDIANSFMIVDGVQYNLAETEITRSYTWEKLAKSSDILVYTASTGIDIINYAISTPAMTGADGTNAGTLGAVPAPAATDNTKFLRGDGTWADIVTDLENLSDVNITSPTNGQALVYNSTTSKFENGTVLSDVKLTDIAMEGTNVTFGYDMQNNYSVQGNAVTISDAGVATGFTTNDYIYKGDGMWNSVCAAGSFEFGIKFKLNTLSNDNYLASIIYASYTGDMKFGLRVDRYGSIQLAINNSMSNAVISPSSNLSTNTWYWVKVVANQNEQVKLYLSTNGTDYNLTGTTTNSYDFTSSTSTYPFILGAYIIYSGTKCSLNGSIDLTETYFKDANGNSLWKPIGLQSEKMFINATDTTYSDFIGATSLVAGTAGLVPAPAATDNEKFLRGDGTWQEVQSGSQPTYDAATRTITF